MDDTVSHYFFFFLLSNTLYKVIYLAENSLRPKKIITRNETRYKDLVSGSLLFPLEQCLV